MADQAADQQQQQQPHEQVVNPWTVEGAVGEDGKQQAIDYDKLTVQFGTKLIDAKLLERFERLTGVRPHPLLRRGLFYSHRELDQILDCYEKKQPFYLYTGRGPSSDSMHLGHAVPFLFCKWLQDTLDVPLVIQLTDDEKAMFRGLAVEETFQYTLKNVRDIAAVGFDPRKTFIFSNLEYNGGAFYHNIVRISKCITTSTSKATFGFSDDQSVGKLHFVCVQAAPSFSNTFPHIFGRRSDIRCLIPCAIDQDPYFRLTRDVAHKLKYPKPALIHAKFFPALQGPQSKMSGSDSTSAIFLSDTPKQVRSKINKYAFSGGKATVEEHRALGGDPDVDVAFQYLTFFEDDDAVLAELAEQYRSGQLLSGEMKAKCADSLVRFVEDFQRRRAEVTDELIRQFMDASKPMPWARERGYVNDSIESAFQLLTIAAGDDSKDAGGKGKKGKKEKKAPATGNPAEAATSQTQQ
ncbi:tryptophan--tRNA ligase [Sorochytrium milnesiophthora]